MFQIVMDIFACSICVRFLIQNCYQVLMPFLHNVTGFASVKCRTILMIQCEECSDRWVTRIFYQEKVTFQSHGGLNKGGNATTHYTFSLLLHFVSWKDHFVFCMNGCGILFFLLDWAGGTKRLLVPSKKMNFFFWYLCPAMVLYNSSFAHFFSLNGQKSKVAKTCVLILTCFFVSNKCCGNLYGFWFTYKDFWIAIT